MKEKIIAELKKKYAGQPNELLGLIAEKLLPKVTAEDQIQGAIDELEQNSPIPVTELGTFLQREGDRRVSEATRTHERTLREKYDFKEKGTPPPPPNPPGGGDNELARQLAELQKRLDEKEAAEKRQNLQAEFIKKLEAKKIPISFARHRNLESEDQMEALIAETEADFIAVRQEFANEGLGGVPKPPGSHGRADVIDADINEWAAKGKAASEA